MHWTSAVVGKEEKNAVSQDGKGKMCRMCRPAKSDKIKCREIKFRAQQKRNETSRRFLPNHGWFFPCRSPVNRKELGEWLWVWGLGYPALSVWGIGKAYFKKLKMQNFICATCGTPFYHGSAFAYAPGQMHWMLDAGYWILGTGSWFHPLQLLILLFPMAVAVVLDETVS